MYAWSVLFTRDNQEEGDEVNKVPKGPGRSKERGPLAVSAKCELLLENTKSKQRKGNLNTNVRKRKMP